MFVDRTRTDIKDIGDIAVRFAAGNPDKDFGFAGGESKILPKKNFLLTAAGLCQAIEIFIRASAAEEGEDELAFTSGYLFCLGNPERDGVKIFNGGCQPLFRLWGAPQELTGFVGCEQKAAGGIERCGHSRDGL